MTASPYTPPGGAASARAAAVLPADAETTRVPVTWADPARAAAFEAWLARIAPLQGLATDTLRLASADASFRRYFRIDAAGPAGHDATTVRSRIVMDAPPAQEDSEPFVRIAQLLREAGVHAPQVLDWDRAHGFLLLDDLGRRTMLDAIDARDPASALPLYEAAIDELIRWQLGSRPGVLPPYDRALLERELALFPNWYITRHRGVTVEGRLQERLERSFRLIVENNLSVPAVYVHRDFMPRNLMLADDPAEAGARLGVLDFQDAVHGPITYDIASLMRDAFLSWEEDFVIDVTVRYWQAARKAGLPVDADFGHFYRTVEWMGLQRHLKVAGIFARLTLRDGKPRYLADTPRFIAYIRATASRYMELTPLLRVVDEVEGTQAQSGFAYGRI
jgi:aminoglycoside/choline kinase family phosphotransferase